jgi:hypothetical protein
MNWLTSPMQLSVKRRITVQTFKGATLIALREYYEKDGKALPGKQGISLNAEQFAVLLKAAPAIISALATKGIDIRDEKEESDVAEDDDDDDDDDDEEEEEDTKSERDAKKDLNDDDEDED